MNKILFPIVACVGFVAILIVFVAGMGYQNGAFELGQAFAWLRWGAYTGIAAAVLAIVYVAWKRPTGIKLGIMALSLVLGATAFYLPYRQSQIAQSVPPIHDITTDMLSPPEFVAIAPIRASAPNPAEYAGPETAAQQAQAYPDIQTITYNQSMEDVFAAATGVVESMGWELVDANMADGRIEATATTRWFGFKDDVVIRLRQPTGNTTVFDMRSKSRVGRSDVGVNANRIRSFTAALNAAL